MATLLWGVTGAAWALTSIEAGILPFWVVSLTRATRVGRSPASEAMFPSKAPVEA